MEIYLRSYYRLRAWARISKYKARPKRDISISGTDRPSSKQYQSWTDRCPVHRPRAVSGGPKIGRFKPGGPKFARPGTSLLISQITSLAPPLQRSMVRVI